MATAVQIRTRAATMLGIHGEGQTLPSAKAEDLDASYVEVYAQLSIKDQVTWDFDEDIPDEYAPHITALVAWGRVINYPVDPKRYQLIQFSASKAPLEIKELQASDAYSTPTAKYY